MFYWVVMRSTWTGGETTVSTSWDDLALPVHRRDEGAFERLVERCERPLFNYVRRLVADARDAQEVVQDAFLRVHHTLTRQYDAARCAELALRPWVFRIARNLALNRLRRRGRKERESSHEGGTELPAAAPAPGITVLCEIERQEELQRLEAAIARLPRPSRELVVLRFIEEMTYAEIARTVGGSEASLRGKVFRALSALRAELADDHGRKEGSDAV